MNHDSSFLHSKESLDSNKPDAEFKNWPPDMQALFLPSGLSAFILAGARQRIAEGMVDDEDSDAYDDTLDRADALIRRQGTGQDVE